MWIRNIFKKKLSNYLVVYRDYNGIVVNAVSQQDAIKQVLAKKYNVEIFSCRQTN